MKNKQKTRGKSLYSVQVFLCKFEVESACTLECSHWFPKAENSLQVSMKTNISLETVNDFRRRYFCELRKRHISLSLLAYYKWKQMYQILNTILIWNFSTFILYFRHFKNYIKLQDVCFVIFSKIKICKTILFTLLVWSSLWNQGASHSFKNK